MKYIVITTARNEEKTISKVINSVKKQSIKPLLHVIADDSSNDDTKVIAKKLGSDVIEIKNPRMPYKGYNQALAFIEAMNYANKQVPDWDYILKLDADSVIPFDYMEYLISKFNEIPSLGISAGISYGENRILSRVTDGARVISRECYRDIGGYHVLMAFDSHALLLAKQYGYRTRIFPEKKYWELRPSKKYSIKAWIHLGFERKQMYLPFYHTFLASGKNALTGKPRILNFFFTVISHIIYRPKKYAPGLDKEWVKKYAIQEVKEFVMSLL